MSFTIEFNANERNSQIHSFYERKSIFSPVFSSGVKVITKSYHQSYLRAFCIEKWLIYSFKENAHKNVKTHGSICNACVTLCKMAFSI